MKMLLENILEESLLLEGVVNKISLQQAKDENMFGPVYHGTTEEAKKQIEQSGFQIFGGTKEDNYNISHGFPYTSYGNAGIPPVHFLGYGIYFTTVLSIAKKFNGLSERNLKTYFINTKNIATINFGSPNTIMKWWMQHGYDPKKSAIDKKSWVQSTEDMTSVLKSKYDAVYFKGKGLYRLLDGDQICVYDVSLIHEIDKTLSKPGDIGSKVIRKSDGMKGILLNKREIPREISLKYHDGETHFLEIKWAKGEKDWNVKSRDIEFV